jgi:uncharacterized membrane protein
MTWLALGLALFLGIHLTRALAPQWRAAQIARLGVLWPHVPFGVNHLTALLMLVAAVLMAAAYVPRNHIKAKLKHPMTLSVKVWAFAHLIVNNTLADVMLFGSFLVWAILVFRAARRRPAPPVAPGTAAGTAATVVVGVALWAVFAFWAHAAWLGIAPLAR